MAGSAQEGYFKQLRTKAWKAAKRLPLLFGSIAPKRGHRLPGAALPAACAGIGMDDRAPCQRAPLIMKLSVIVFPPWKAASRVGRREGNVTEGRLTNRWAESCNRYGGFGRISGPNRGAKSASRPAVG